MNPLSPRERECLTWAAQGKTSWEVGRILGISERTVNFHINNACGKLQVRTRQAAITTALQHQLISVRVAGAMPTRSQPPVPVQWLRARP